MKRDEIPMMRNVLTQAIQSEAVARASLWAMARLTFALRQHGVFDDAEIADLFDPDEIKESISEGFRDIAKQAVGHLRDQSLGRVRSKH